MTIRPGKILPQKVTKAMFTLYLIDFRPDSEIDPIHCEQCSGKSNRTGRYVVELFTSYWVDMPHTCFGLAKET